MKRSLMFLLPLSAMLLSVHCSNPGDAELLYSNPFDPRSERYLPKAPLATSSTFVGDSAIVITWTDGDPYSGDGFTIRRSIANANSWASMGRVGMQDTMFIDTLTLTQNTHYYYIVAETNGEREGYDSEPFDLYFTFPPPVFSPAQSLSSSSARITWSGVDWDISYSLQRSVNGSAYSSIATVYVPSKSHVDAALDTLNTYRYQVRRTSARHISTYRQSSTIRWDGAKWTETL